MDISFNVCVCVCFYGYGFLRRRPFIGLQGSESQILVNFAPSEAQNWTNRRARRPRSPAFMHRSLCHVVSGRRNGMCGYPSVSCTDGRVVVFFLLFLIA